MTCESFLVPSVMKEHRERTQVSHKYKTESLNQNLKINENYIEIPDLTAVRMTTIKENIDASEDLGSREPVVHCGNVN